ncbi:MAG: alpha/beta fold hydrolase [Lewinellaceae bacterium]|nr:alpha/beta fold hydrolase [Phaeodactylibacter sp.]MCB0616624.1 alpha/beta fold hydrolase [Phaeodactylibacter sp.]MCB9347177.1 alpha/beta fold hydrolase [Lewinellaceae bacterium]
MKKVLLMLFPLLTISIAASAINPSRQYINTPDSLGLEYQALEVSTPDGCALNTWILAPNPEKDNETVLVLAYGDAGNMSHFVYHAAAFLQQGFTVVAFDYRGFGKSSDFPIRTDYLYHTEFLDDLSAVVAYAEANIPHRRLGIWALSMGTILATQAAAREEAPIDFVLAEGFVANTRQQVSRINALKGKTVILPEPASRYRRAVRRVKIPLLVFAATEDEITTLADAEGLAAGKQSPCRVIQYKGGHLRGFQALSKRGFGDGYVAEVIRFLQENDG